MNKELTEVHCSNCGELIVIKQKELKKYNKCKICGSKDINEA